MIIVIILVIIIVTTSDKLLYMLSLHHLQQGFVILTIAAPCVTTHTHTAGVAVTMTFAADEWCCDGNA